MYANVLGEGIFMSVMYFEMHQKCKMEEFPGDPVARTQHFYCNDPGSIPGQRTKIPQATQCGKKKKKKSK